MDEPTDDPPPGKAPRRAKGGTPVDQLGDTDRELVTQTTRRAYQILELMVERMWDAVVDSDGVPSLDRDNAQAMLNLQRMAAGMIDKHPGLLAEVQATGVDPAMTDEELDDALEAVDV